MHTHHEFMRLAVEKSKQGAEKGEGGPFGAVIVLDGKIIGEGNNKVLLNNDPTAHAEVVAIRNACKNIKNFSLENAVLYTSCEPCPMCLSAIFWARISKVYFGNTREDAKEIGFDDEFFYRQVCNDIHARHIPFVQTGQEEAKKVFEEWKNKQDKTMY
jgi:tRNA(Arg) A34 adenosine deaminase TadA